MSDEDGCHSNPQTRRSLWGRKVKQLTCAERLISSYHSYPSDGSNLLLLTDPGLHVPSLGRAQIMEDAVPFLPLL